MNDLLSEYSRICEHVVLSELKCKTNWLIEILNLKQAIPKTWLNILTTEASLRTKVKTTLDNSPVNYIEHMSNKQIRITYVHVQFQRPYIHIGRIYSDNT